MYKIIFFVLLTAAMMVSSCGDANSAAQNAVDGDKKLSIPANVRNSEADNDIYRESALLLSVTFGGSETVYKNKPLDCAQFDDLLNRYVETHAPSDYHAYLKIDSRTDYGRAVDIFKLLRERQIKDVRLVVSPTAETDSPPADGVDESNRRGNVIRVEIPANNAPLRKSKEPGASNLTLEIDKDNRFRLCGENLTAAELLAKLSEVFAYRNKVYWMREGTNVIDQSVRLKAPRSMSFGEVVKTVDLLGDARESDLFTN